MPWHCASGALLTVAQRVHTNVAMTSKYVQIAAQGLPQTERDYLQSKLALQQSDLAPGYSASHDPATQYQQCHHAQSSCICGSVAASGCVQQWQQRFECHTGQHLCVTLTLLTSIIFGNMVLSSEVVVEDTHGIVLASCCQVCNAC